MKPSNKDTDTKQTLNQKQTATGGKKNEEDHQEDRIKEGLITRRVICVVAIICIIAGAILFNYIHIFRNAIDALGGI